MAIDLEKYRLKTPTSTSVKGKIDLEKYRLKDNTFPTQEPEDINRSFMDRVRSLVGNAAQAQKDFNIGALKEVGTRIIDTAQAGKNILDKGIGTIGLSPQPDDPRVTNAINNAKDYLTQTNTAQKIGGTAEKIGEFMLPGNVGAKAGKVAELASGGSKLAKLAGLGVNALTEAGTNAGITALQGGDKGEVKTAAIVGGALPVAGKVLQKVGQGIAEYVIPTSAKEAQIVQKYKADNKLLDRLFTSNVGEEPITTAKTAFDRNIKGISESDIGIKAKREADKLWGTYIKPSLDNANIEVNIPSFFESAKKQIIKENPEISRQKDLLNALEALKQDYAGVQNVSLSDLQNFKQGWAKFVPEKVYKGKPIAGAFNDIKNTLADNARDLIYNTLGKDVKKAYFDYGNLVGLQEFGQKAMTGGKLKGGAGAFVSAIKDAALIPVGTIGGKIVYKAGQGIELYGKPGAKFLKDIISPDKTK